MTDRPTIPFNRTEVEGRELDYIRESVEGGHTSTSGPFSRRVPAATVSVPRTSTFSVVDVSHPRMLVTVTTTA